MLRSHAKVLWQPASLAAGLKARRKPVLKAFQATHPLRYIVQSENLGPDRNFDAVVAEARGEYCWLLGSDDVVQPGGVRNLLAALTSCQTDIVQFGYVQGDLHLRPQHRAAPSAGPVQTSPRSLASHLAAQPNMSLLFTFISVYAFRRSVWMDRQHLIRSWVGSYYIQVFAMHSALASGATLAAVDKCLVIARGGNPNDFNTVPGRFMALDARTMSRLIREVHGDQPQFWLAISQPFRRSYPAKSLLHVAVNGGLDYINEVREILLRFGYSKAFLQLLQLFQQLKLLPIVKWLLDSRRRVLEIFKRQVSLK